MNRAITVSIIVNFGTVIGKYSPHWQYLDQSSPSNPSFPLHSQLIVTSDIFFAVTRNVTDQKIPARTDVTLNLP